MKFILGRKEKMTQLFNESGEVVPGTIISAGPMIVTMVQNGKVQIGVGTRRLKNIAKPQHGAGKLIGKEGFGFAQLKEFKTDGDLKVGDQIDVSTFAEGDKITVSAITKGKGFQGVVKRHGFKGGRRSHGQKHSEREPGSIGVGGQQRVMPGRRMGGRMGGERMTFKNLTVARVDKENNQLFIKGAIPGRQGTLVEITGI